MAEDIGIVMTLYDKLSPTLKAMGNNTKAFDKNIQQLEQACAAYEKTQESLNKDISTLKSKLVESSEAVKDATTAWKKNKDELSRGVMDKAIAEQNTYRQQLKDTESALNSSRKAVTDYSNEQRKAANAADARAAGTGGGGAGAEGGAKSLGQGLMTAGLGKMLGDSLGVAANAFLGSAIGEPGAQMVSSTLSGAISGAAMGALLGPAGMAVGGLIGGASGAIAGGAELFKAQDDAFKAYNQDQYGAIQERRGAELQGGSGIAAKRETDLLSFSNALGSETAAAGYLTELKDLANTTPFLYDDLSALSKTLLAYGTDKGAIIPTLTAVGDTGAAKGMGTEDISAVAVALGRMQSTDKASLEYINLLTERGVGAVDWLAARDGLSVADVYDKISKGKYSGKEVSAFFVEKMNEEFGGMMDAQSQTFAGRGSTLEGWEQEMQNATGDGYNAVKGEGIAQQNAYYEGIAGSMAEMNGIIGESKAYQENLNDQYGREAMSALLEGQQTTLYEPQQAEELQSMHQAYNDLLGQYQAAEEEDKAGLGAKIEALKGEAEGMAESAFNASTGMQAVKDVQLDLIAALRENTAALGAGAWRTQYDINQGHNKGMAAVRYADAAKMQTDTSGGRQSGRFSRAMGQNTIPYDNFPILAHQGERLLTASQARAADGGGGDVQVSFTGPVTVREEADLDKLARKFATEFRRASLLAAPG